MAKKNTVKQGVALTLSACMVTNSFPLQSYVINAKTFNQPAQVSKVTTTKKLTFDNAQSRGGWAVDTAQNKGTCTFTDTNADVSGFMTLSSEATTDNTFFTSSQATSRTNGYMEMDVTSTTDGDGRILFLLRYQDKDNWEGVGIDGGGHWVWEYRENGDTSTSPWGNLANSNTFKAADKNNTHKIRIEYQGKHIKITDNSTTVFDGDVPRFKGNQNAKQGIRLWGTQGKASSFKIDNLETGDLTTTPSTPATSEFVDFSNDANKGGWNKENGQGTIDFDYNEGCMKLASVRGETYLHDNNVQSRQNGFMEMDVTYTSNHTPDKGRIMFLFRYKDKDNWEGVGLDGGKWVWQCARPNVGASPWGDITSTINQTYFTNNDHEKHHIRIEYNDKKVTITDNGKTVCKDQVIDRFVGNYSGKVGIRLWGDTHSSTFKIDNVRTGDLTSEPTLGQTIVDIDKTDISKDINVSLNTNGIALTKIKNNTTELTKDTDYTYDETNQRLTIKSTYLNKIKDSASTTLTLEFANGITKTLTINIAVPEAKVNYVRDFTKNVEGFTNKKQSGTLTHDTNGVTVKGDGIFIDDQSASLKDQEVEFLYNPTSYATNYGVILRYVNNNDYIYVGPSSQNNQHFTRWGVYNQSGRIAEITDNGFLIAGRTTPYKVKVRVVDNVVTVFVDNEQIFNKALNISTKAGKVGFRTTSANTGMIIKNFTQTNARLPKVVTSTITEKSIATDKLTVKLDNDFPRVISYALKDGNTTKTVAGQELAIHELEINNKLYKPTITSTFTADTATYHVNETETGISFDVVMNVKNNVLTMKIVNVKESKNVKLYTLNFPQHSLVSMSDGNLTVNNYQGQNTFALKNRAASKEFGETTLAVLHDSNAGVAAALSGESYKNRHEVAYQTFAANGHSSTGLWLNEYTYRGLDDEVMIQEPWTKVSITADRNQDGKVDMQDGAIALRDDCMKRKVGADIVTDSWMQIAMNVGSEAQMPFLRILDNVQKMALATDNFEQHIVIKGYQGEGHDSMHPDFANYNKRAGGLKDFNTLLSESEKYNAKIGIHVNHTDIYPEAPQFDAIASKDAPAWDWYDSSKMIVRENDGLDKSDKGMDKRFEKLYVTDTKNQIDTTYVDVFFGTRWPLYNLVKNIAGRGIVLGTENSDEMVSHSVFSHGIQTEANRYKGKNNLVRFIENNQSDIFQRTDLFRGVDNRNANWGSAGVLGWQQNGVNNAELSADFDTALDTFYTKILPQKFLAQYPLMIYNQDNQATLGTKNEVITKVVNGKNIITLDNKEVANDNTIFIPWQTKDEKGAVKDQYGKIYHYNQKGGNSTWSLPKSWNGATKVYMYELSAKGKGSKTALTVTDGKVNINAKAKTPYVIYKEEAVGISAETLNWSVGSHVKETGFDSYAFNNWKPSSTANSTSHITIKDNELGNANLFIEGVHDGKVTQTITNLIPGKTYSASVWCTTDNGRKASISVDNDGEIVTNYMDSSNVRYGFHHSDKYKSKAQRMQVRFVAKTDTATLTLSADKGSSNTSTVKFDDVRIMQVGVSNNPKNYTYWEDFENVDQGLGLFISEETDKSHLSYKNQVNPEYTNDVINGNYSLKIRRGDNADGYAADVMRTIPSTVRFKPNTKYTVGITYKVNNGGFKFAACNGQNQDIVAKDLTGKGKATLDFTTDASGNCYVKITCNTKGNEVIIDDFYVQEALEMNYANLQKLINEATNYASKDYTTKSFAKLQTALKAAQAIKENDTKENIEKAYIDLENSIKSLVALASAEDKKLLEDEIKYMESLPKSDYHQDDKWVMFEGKIANARKELSNKELTQERANALIQELRDAKDALNPTVNRDALKAIMKQALRVNGEAIVDGPYSQNFFSAIKNAKDADAKAGVTKDEIDKVTADLTKAYKEITFKDPFKNTLVNEALERIEGLDSRYFFDKDWDAIQSAKATLDAMSTQSDVLVHKFYEAFDQLENALANQSATIVVPSSMKIELNMSDNDASNGAVETNTEHPQTGSEGPIKFAFDGDLNTLWHSKYSPKFDVSASNPATVTINLGKKYNINKFGYIQRRGSLNGQIKKFNLYVSNDKQQWTKVVENGSFTNNPNEQFAKFNTVNAQYVKLEVTQGEGGFATAAEFALYQKTSDFAQLQTLMNTVNKLDKTLYEKAYLTDLNKAYDEAVALLDNPLTSQATINAKKDALQKAYDEVLALATKEDAKLLADKLAEANKIDINKYTNTEAFVTARKNANDLATKLAKEKVSHKAVMDVILALDKAQNQLVPVQPEQPKPEQPKPEQPKPEQPKPEQPKPEQPDKPVIPGEPSKPVEKPDVKPDTSKPNQDQTGTGDISSMGMFASMLAASGAALTAIFKRKNKE